MRNKKGSGRMGSREGSPERRLRVGKEVEAGEKVPLLGQGL